MTKDKLSGSLRDDAIVLTILRDRPRDELRKILSQRLRRCPSRELPGLGREEAPSDLFVQVFERHRATSNETFTPLRMVSAELVDKWSGKLIMRKHIDPEPLGELLYLCPRIAAREAIGPIGQIAGSAQFAAWRLPEGEDLQERALRALGGLLGIESLDVRGTYRGHFEQALHTPAHVAIGLTTLATFWPEEREAFMRDAWEFAPPEKAKQLDWISAHFDDIATVFFGELSAPARATTTTF